MYYSYRETIIDQYTVSNFFREVRDIFGAYDFNPERKERLGKTFDGELEEQFEKIRKEVLENIKKNYTIDELVQSNINKKNKTLELIEQVYKESLVGGNFTEDYQKKVIARDQEKYPKRFEAKLRVKDFLIDLIKKIRVADYDLLVGYITKYVREPKLVVDNVLRALSAEYSGLTDTQKENLREYLEVFRLTTMVDPEEAISRQKAEEELNRDPFVEARRIQLLKVAKKLDDQGKFRLADKAERLANIK